MSATSIPVDLLNPGQVFACVGLLEAADVLLGDASGGFDWHPLAPRFHLWARGDRNPIVAVLDFLGAAHVESLAPAGSLNTTAKWRIPTRSLAPDDPFPFRDPDSPATLPACLVRNDQRLVIDSWGDTTRDNVKFWAGSGGYPGAAILNDSLGLVRDALRTGVDAVASDPFSVARPQSNSFRFDWRRDYIPIDAGFSLNEHSRLNPLGFPLVEILAAIGISNARPLRPNRRDKLVYRYGVIGLTSEPHRSDATGAPLPIVRAALGVAPIPWPCRVFQMRLGWPGKENQARCITTVFEERIS